MIAKCFTVQFAKFAIKVIKRIILIVVFAKNACKERVKTNLNVKVVNFKIGQKILIDVSIVKKNI